jgi:hypothetical protein
MTSEPNEPDEAEMAIRFGCGAIFGVFVSILTAFRLAFESLDAIVAIALAVALACGLLAVRYGEAFWYSFLKWLKEFP